VAWHFLIDENLSPLLARHLRTAHGFDAVHVQELGLRGASDADVPAYAIVEDRIIVTSNADDFRKLGARTTAHPGLTVMLDAVGRARQLTLRVGPRTLMTAPERRMAACSRSTAQAQCGTICCPDLAGSS
jgi:predicted nuclease of predicted toxin-antitoxin system